MSHRLCHFSHVDRSRPQLPELECLPRQESAIWTSAGFNVNNLLPGSRLGPEDRNLELRLPCSSNPGIVSLGLSCMTMYKTRHSGASLDRVRGFGSLQEVQRRVSGRLSAVAKDATKSSRLAAHCHSLPRPLRNKLKTLARRVEGLLMGVIGNPSAPQADDWVMYGRCVRWTWLLGESVESSGITWLRARYEVGSQVYVYEYAYVYVRANATHMVSVSCVCVSVRLCVFACLCAEQAQ